jgi:adenylylsulfate kinase
VRTLVKDSEFIEIHCNADLAVCEGRDIKGLYKKARRGEIADFTGISSPYEPPQNPELVINTATETLEDSVNIVLAYLAQRGIIKSAFNE